jgi:hypothetical protein
MDTLLESKRKIMLAVFFLVTIVAIIIGLRLWDHTQQERIGFQGYEPTLLPSDVRIVSKELRYWSGDVRAPQILLTLSKAGVIISEERVTDATTTTDNCPSLRTQTCQVLKTPHHITYYVIVNHFPSGDTSQTIAFTKNHTSIWLSLNTQDAVQAYTGTHWDAIIDSFQPMDPKDIRTTHVRATQ